MGQREKSNYGNENERSSHPCLKVRGRGSSVYASMYTMFHKYTKPVQNRQILDLLLPANYEFIVRFVSYHFYTAVRETARVISIDLSPRARGIISNWSGNKWKRFDDFNNQINQNVSPSATCSNLLKLLSSRTCSAILRWRYIVWEIGRRGNFERRCSCRQRQERLEQTRDK